MISRWIEMICDGCYSGTGDVVHAGDSKAMRREWKKQGWTRVAGKDYCDECSAARSQDQRAEDQASYTSGLGV